MKENFVIEKPDIPDKELLTEIQKFIIECLEEVKIGVSEGKARERLANFLHRIEEFAHFGVSLSRPVLNTLVTKGAIHIKNGDRALVGSDKYKVRGFQQSFHLPSRVKEFEEEVARLNKKVLEHDEFKNEIIMKNQKLEKRVGQVIEEKQVAISALRQNMVHLTQENVRLTEHYKVQTKYTQALENQLSQDSRKENMKLLREEHAANTVKLDISNQIISELRKELTYLQTKLNEVRDQCDVFKQNNSLLATRCVSLEGVIERVKTSNVSCRDQPLAEKYEMLLKEKLSLQKRCNENDINLHSLQDHIFDLESEVRDRDLKIALKEKEFLERGARLSSEKEQALDFAGKIKVNLEQRLESIDDADSSLDEFGLVRVESSFLKQLLEIFPTTLLKNTHFKDSMIV